MKSTLIAVAATVASVGSSAFAAPPSPAPVSTWNGFYAGLNAGWSWGKQDTTANFTGPAVTSINVTTPGGGSATVPVNTSSLAFQDSTHPLGAIAGLQAGYNWQGISNWVFGVEADFQASGESTNAAYQNTALLARLGVSNPPGGPTPVSITASQSLSQNDALLWFGTVRGRAGYTVWPTVMMYGTGGLAYGRLNELGPASYSLAATCGGACTATATLPGGAVVPLPYGSSQGVERSVRIGWTIGGGVEGAVPNTHVTWKVEYLFMDLGTANYTFSGPSLGTITASTHFIDNIVRVGLNYQFH